MGGGVKILGQNFNIGMKEIMGFIAVIFAAGVTYGSVWFTLNKGLDEVRDYEVKRTEKDMIIEARIDSVEANDITDRQIMIKIATNMEDLVIPSLERIEKKVDYHIENNRVDILSKK